MTYDSKFPYKISADKLSQKQIERLTQSKRFCILPWIHMHAFPTGEAFPCCLSDSTQPIGDLHKNTLEEVWNQAPLRQIRVNMLTEQPSKECVKCYEREDNGFFSMRDSSNKSFGHHIGLVDDTKEDGTYEDFKMRYYDIRFSNLCNFKCRSCGSMFSSNWYQDEVKMYGPRDYPQISIAGRHKQDMWEQLLPHIPHIEQIYFAGGEPLIMEEHYRLLRELADREMFNVHLEYNTNFSEMKFKGQDVMELWNQFDSVSIGASLDGSHARGEYIRKGQDWNQTVENRRRMIEICPDVKFHVANTVSLFNALHITDFHREWVELGLIEPKDWSINVLQGPDYERIDILPQHYKDLGIDKINKHIEWLEPQDSLTRATVGYRSLINFMSQENPRQPELLKEFFERNDFVDKFRNESFEEIFPEYAELRKFA
jgi:organic radical activating enzyme